MKNGTKKNLLYLFLANTILLGSCTQEVPIVSLGLDDYYYLPRMKKLKLDPAYIGNGYRWTVKTASGNDSLLSTEHNYIFLTKKEGKYDLTFEVLDSVMPYKHNFSITVMHEQVEYSPYLAHVYEYRPAPGQFVNLMPIYQEGDTEATMCKKAEQDLSGKNDIMVSLGSYGGYITFGFDHTVVNIKGEKDFAIFGNSFYELTDPSKKGGSAEPGIVMVAYDRNMNGKPDQDEWYELAGSEYYPTTTIKGYEITYHRPDPNKKPVPDMTGNINDTEYIPWRDNQGETGFVAKNTFHTQDYYPKWIKADELTFKGTLLPKNAVDISGFGSYFILYSYDWGYVDNHPNDLKDLNSFDIGWAIDKNGNPVHLPGVDFIRVYTGVNQYCGHLGETSTEITRAQDLHIEVRSEIIPDPIP